MPGASGEREEECSADLSADRERCSLGFSQWALSDDGPADLATEDPPGLLSIRVIQKTVGTHR